MAGMLCSSVLCASERANEAQPRYRKPDRWSPQEPLLKCAASMFLHSGTFREFKSILCNAPREVRASRVKASTFEVRLSECNGWATE
jgi:hypothetical protein